MWFIQYPGVAVFVFCTSSSLGHPARYLAHTSTCVVRHVLCCGPLLPQDVCMSFVISVALM